MVKPIAYRQSSQDGAHISSQNSANSKMMPRIRNAKVEKSNTTAQLNNVTATNSGNKSAYQA